MINGRKCAYPLWGSLLHFWLIATDTHPCAMIIGMYSPNDRVDSAECDNRGPSDEQQYETLNAG
jgi:hypothetical protein